MMSTSNKRIYRYTIAVCQVLAIFFLAISILPQYVTGYNAHAIQLVENMENNTAKENSEKEIESKEEVWLNGQFEINFFKLNQISKSSISFFQWNPPEKSNDTPPPERVILYDNK